MEDNSTVSVSSDIKNQVDRDAGLLAEAIRRGDILAGEKVLTAYLTDDEVELLVTRILRFAMTEKLISVYIHALSSMTWMNMTEARLHSRKSKNTLIKAAEEKHIYGDKAEGTEEWTFSRASIDNWLGAGMPDYLKRQLLFPGGG